MISSARRLRNDSSDTVSVVEIGQTDTVNEVFTVMYEGRHFGAPLNYLCDGMFYPAMCLRDL